METSGKPTMTGVAPQDRGKVEAPVRASGLERVRECGEIACMRLSDAFSAALKQAGERLFKKSLQGYTVQEQEKWLKAAEFVRGRRQAMVESFRKLFEQRFPQACNRQPSLLAGHLLGFDASQLKIETHATLETGLNPDSLVEAIRNGSWTSMHQLTDWFRKELERSELSANDMPVGARLIGAVASQAIEDQFGLPTVKEFVLAALCRTFPERVNVVYRDLAMHVGNLPASADAPALPVAAPTPGPERVSDAAPAATLRTGDEVEAMEASRAASEVLDPWLAGKRLPSFVAEFLNGPWRAVLARIHLEHGVMSPEWEAARATLDELMDSLRLKHTTEERSHLMKSLPELVKHLGRGLEAIDEPVEARRAFFARLAEYHLRLIQKSRAEAATAQAGSVPAPAPAQATSQPAVAETAWLETLQTGTWLEVRTPQGAFQKLKLAWISPQRSLFLLTNTLGERVLSLGAENFAALLREGHARIVQGAEGGKSGGIIVNKPQFRKIG